MSFEKEVLGIYVRHYRVYNNHGRTVRLVPVPTEGESREDFYRRGPVLIGKRLKKIRTYQCDWLGYIWMTCDGPVATLKASEKPLLLDVYGKLLPGSEVHLFGIAPHKEDLSGDVNSLFIALPNGGLEKGAIVTIGHCTDIPTDPSAVDTGYQILSYLAEKTEQEFRERGAQCWQANNEG